MMETKELFYYNEEFIYTPGAHSKLKNTEGIYGNCSKIFGNAKNITGDVSSLTGDVSKLSGDMSKCRTFKGELKCEENVSVAV